MIPAPPLPVREADRHSMPMTVTPLLSIRFRAGAEASATGAEPATGPWTKDDTKAGNEGLEQGPGGALPPRPVSLFGSPGEGGLLMELSTAEEDVPPLPVLERLRVSSQVLLAAPLSCPVLSGCFAFSEGWTQPLLHVPPLTATAADGYGRVWLQQGGFIERLTEARAGDSGGSPVEAASPFAREGARPQLGEMRAQDLEALDAALREGEFSGLLRDSMQGVPPDDAEALCASLLGTLMGLRGSLSAASARRASPGRLSSTSGLKGQPHGRSASGSPVVEVVVDLTSARAAPPTSSPLRPASSLASTRANQSARDLPDEADAPSQLEEMLPKQLLRRAVEDPRTTLGELLLWAEDWGLPVKAPSGAEEQMLQRLSNDDLDSGDANPGPALSRHWSSPVASGSSGPVAVEKPNPELGLSNASPVHIAGAAADARLLASPS